MRILTRLQRFLRDPRGTASVEAIIILPLLLWGYIATFVYFDAFRMQNLNLKAAYTIVDMISRETGTINPTYINGLNTVYDYLTNTNAATSIRVSSVNWDAATGRYNVQWSYATKSQPVMDNTQVNLFKTKLPKLPVGDTLIVVETNLPFTPDFPNLNLGVKATTFTQFISTRPRFTSKVCYTSTVPMPNPAPACAS